MTPTRIIILGTKGMGMDIADTIACLAAQGAAVEVRGFLDDDVSTHGGHVGGHPVLGSVLTVLVALHVLVFALSGARINKLVNILGAREHLVLAYAEMLRLGATAELSAPESQRLKQRLHGADGERPAHVELAALADLSSALNLRRHPILWFPVNLLTMWDLFFALRVEAWQARSGPRVRDWFTALGDLEAYAALATLGADNPGWAWPEVVDGPARLEAEALGGPACEFEARDDVTP